MLNSKKDTTRHLAWLLRDALVDLVDDPQGFAKVPGIFAEARGTKAQKADIFIMLDSTPGHFGMGSWHAVLRQCRNHPVHGRELFAIWR